MNEKGTALDSTKVISALEALSKAMSENQCYTCSHEFVDVAEEFGTNIISDAITLLKTQDNIIRILTLNK